MVDRFFRWLRDVTRSVTLNFDDLAPVAHPIARKPVANKVARGPRHVTRARKTKPKPRKR